MSKKEPQKQIKFPFNTVIEDGYVASVTINDKNDVVIIVGFGQRVAALKFTDKLRGRHKYE